MRHLNPRGSRHFSASVSALAFAAALLPAPAAAQDQAPPAADVAQDDDQAIIVTGSRIARPELTSPNPVTSVGADAILLSGETNLTDYLQGIPALVGSLGTADTSGSNPNAFIGSTGLNLLNLRNLGIQRTLVLVDGRRHVAQLPETAAVDIGTIPQDLIARIDVATGGVSAVYGADAVSGVVNFVIRRDFEGLTARAQVGMADDGEPLNWTASLTAGHNFAGGRGNVAIAYQYTHEGRLRARERSYLRGDNYCTLQQNINDPNDDPNVPDNIPFCGVQFFDSSREGAIDVDFDTSPDFRPNGDVYNIGTFIPGFYSVGGDGTPRSDYIGDILAENDRHLVNAFLNYEFSPAIRFFGEIKYANSRAFSEAQPTFDYTIFISEENPFIPAGVRSRIIPGIGDDLSAAFGLPPGSIPDGIALARDNFDLGVRAERNRSETWRGVAGFNGEVADGIRYELSYVYGQSSVRFRSINNRFNDRFFAALDVVADPVTGQPVCRSNLDPNALRDQPTYNFFQGFFFDRANLSFTPGPNSGCVPLNLFGEGSANPAAIDWVFTDSLGTSKLTQNVVSGFLSGNIPGFELPGGPIGFVVGAEYRRESSRSTPPPEDTAGQTFGNQIFPVSGNFDVREAFAELRIPILADRPFFHELELNGAARVSDYSTIGTAWTWNTGVRWAPVRDIAFRGTYARTVRAPNIAELFAPQSQDFQFITDPCDVDNINNGASTRPANCAAILTALGFNPATFQDPNSSNISGLSGGNEDLDEETAKSWTVGAVLRPSFIPGLTVTVDWYDIQIRDAINTAAPQEIADLCVDQPTIDNVFCDALTRSATTGGINGFIRRPENVAAFRTAGLDFDIAYRFDPARFGLGSNIGIFNIRLFGNYLDRLTFISTPGAELDDDRTEQFAPKWQTTLDITWVRGPLTVNYGFNYFSRTTVFSLEQIAGDPDIADDENRFYDSRHTHDVQVAYNVFDNFRIYAGVNNIGNQRPDLSTSYPVNPVGRFFYFGARVNLPGL